jgi:hypothetical protein
MGVTAIRREPTGEPMRKLLVSCAAAGLLLVGTGAAAGGRQAPRMKCYGNSLLITAI